jgi:hypothetical protein
VIAFLAHKIDLGGHRGTLAASADALDAVICSFAAIAAVTGNLQFPPNYEFSRSEGWIAVHK